MAFEIRPYPEFSWSTSRNQIFEECKRKYYYQYYGSHNGWLSTSDEVTKHIYRLKQLTNLYMLFGKSLHEIAKRCIKNKTTYDRESLIDEIKNNLNNAYFDSKDKNAFIYSPKKVNMLNEMYYNGMLPKDVVGEIKNRIPACVDNLLKSKTINEIIYNKNIDIVENDEGLNFIMLNDKKIFAILDVLYTIDNEKWIVVDWKTGSESESINEQLILYALYVYTKYAIPVENIELRIEYLLTGECTSVNIREQDMKKMLEKIKYSQNEMESYLNNKSINEPFPYQSFEKTTQKFKCKNCSFKEICDMQ